MEDKSVIKYISVCVCGACICMYKFILEALQWVWEVNNTSLSSQKAVQEWMLFSRPTQ